jgi:hypothetical protein
LNIYETEKPVFQKKRYFPVYRKTAPAYPEPLQSSKLPEKAWANVAVDFVGPFSTGEYLLVIIQSDEYSRYSEVEILTTTSVKATIPKLNAIFARQGIPEILKSDSGPPFNSEEFEFCNTPCFQASQNHPILAASQQRS